MEGYGLLSRSITIYFRADVAPLLRNRNQGVIYVHNPNLRGFFRIDRTGGKGFLVINTVGEDVTRPEAVDVSSNLTPEQPLELLRQAIGTDMPMEILEVVHWQAEANNAARYQDGRIFLAGDAAHVVPPNGGFGGNTGVQDAHNIAWKLAAVLKGDAGPGLLDTYDAERRPIGGLTVDQAYTRYATRVVPERGTEGVKPFVPDIEIEIGWILRSSAVLSEPGDDGAVHVDPSQTGGRPGTRAPHVALDGHSTLDLLGDGFVLLTGPEGEGWSAAGRADARRHCARVPGGVRDLAVRGRAGATGRRRRVALGRRPAPRRAAWRLRPCAWSRPEDQEREPERDGATRREEAPAGGVDPRAHVLGERLAGMLAHVAVAVGDERPLVALPVLRRARGDPHRLEARGGARAEQAFEAGQLVFGRAERCEVRGVWRPRPEAVGDDDRPAGSDGFTEPREAGIEPAERVHRSEAARRGIRPRPAGPAPERSSRRTRGPRAGARACARLRASAMTISEASTPNPPHP